MFVLAFVCNVILFINPTTEDMYSRLRGVIVQRADIFNASITNSNFAAS